MSTSPRTSNSDDLASSYGTLKIMGGGRLGHCRGTPGCSKGTPGNIIGTPGCVKGTPGFINGTPGCIKRIPGWWVGRKSRGGTAGCIEKAHPAGGHEDEPVGGATPPAECSKGTPGYNKGAPGYIKGTPGCIKGTPRWVGRRNRSFSGNGRGSV